MSLAGQISLLATRVAAEIGLRGMPNGGAAGQVLQKSSGADFAAAWVTPSGAAAAVQTTTLTAVNGDFTTALAPAFTILSVAYSGAGRLRLYRTAAGRTADASRASTTAYPGGRGLLYGYLASGAETDQESPADGAYGAGEAQLYGRLDGGPVDVTITWVQTGASA